MPQATNHGRFLLTGFVAWLLATILLHWLPLPIRLESRPTSAMIMLAFVNSAFFAVVVLRMLRRVPKPERLGACAAIVLPGALGDAVAMACFADFFPRVNPAASHMLAALLLLTYAVILATGLFAGLNPGSSRRCAIE